MLAKRWSRGRPDAEPEASGALAVRLVLAAALVPAALGTGDVDVPFGMPRALFGAPLALVVGLTVWAVARRGASRRARVARAALLAAALAAGAALAERIVAARATGFYTRATLSEVLTVLLGVHLLGALARRAGGSPAPATAGTRQADYADAAAAVALALFWLLAAAGMREMAGVLLLVAGAFLVAALPLRIGEAWTAASLGDRIRARRHGRLGAASRRRSALAERKE